MILFKYLLSLFFFFGLYSELIQAKPLKLSNNKIPNSGHVEYPSKSEEIEWLHLLYLKENAKFATHSEEAVLSLNNQKLHKNPDLVDSWKVVKYCDDPVLAAKATDIAELELVSKHLDEINTAGGYKSWRNTIEGISKRNIKTLSGEEIIKVGREGSTKITSKFIIANNLDAATANHQFTGQQIQRFGMSVDLTKVNPPHANIPRVGVNDLKLLEKKYFVRVSSSSNNSAGEWIMSLEDFKKFKSSSEIKNGLALPVEPTHFNIVQIPEGTIIRESQAAKVWQEGAYWGNGGTKQYQIQNFHQMEKNITDGWFSVSKSLSKIF